MRFRGYFLFIAVFLLLFISESCRKKQQLLTSGGVLEFSSDTLTFDTVFTALGSYTSGVLIYNPQSDVVVLSSVRMEKGANSYFKLNVDGVPGNNATNIRIAPHDSVYVFATVTVDPNDSLTPFFITDRLIATMNGKEFSMPFTAYGQNAHYIVGDSITANTTWQTDLPYVVIRTCVVGPGKILTIPPKCRVYMHQSARIMVYGGLITGSATDVDSVVFQGDRLDRDYFGYQGYPGEWCGIWFLPRSQGLMNKTILKNCGGNTGYYGYFSQPAAIRVDTLADLWMDRCVIKNSIGFGLFDWSGHVVASNSLFHTTGAQALAIVQGGRDTFVNCTFANYGNHAISHTSEPTVAILNYFRISQTQIFFGNLTALMQNCVVYGSLDSEMICDSSVNAGASLTVNNCLVRMGTVREPFIHFSETIFNKDPMFKDEQNEDFRLKDNSPARGTGKPPVIGGGKDLEGNDWGGLYDIGCYKYK